MALTQTAGLPAPGAEIRSGAALLYYLYEIAEEIDLRRMERILGPESSKARMAFKHGAPSYLQFQNPPLVIAGEPLEWGSYPFQSRIKFFDYGVVSVTLRAPFAGSWKEFVELSADVLANSDIEAAVAAALARRLERLGPALIKPNAQRMVEDYAVFGVHQMAEAVTGPVLAGRYAPAIAQLLRGERAGLSDLETAEVMSNQLSYQPEDLLVASWNAAFLFDTPAGLEATAEILEFANSQLLEYRYYDQVITAQLAAVYQEMDRGFNALHPLRSFQYRRTAKKLNSLYLEVLELTEKSENSLKFFGDLFASRVYRVAAQRLGLNEWKNLVNGKLQSAAVLYRSLIDEASSLRMEVLELLIVVILVLELVMGLMGKHI